MGRGRYYVATETLHPGYIVVLERNSLNSKCPYAKRKKEKYKRQ